MKEVDCVHCMGVSSHSSNTLGCQRRVNAVYRGGGEVLVGVVLKLLSGWAPRTPIPPPFLKGPLLNLCLLSFNSKLDFVTRTGTACRHSGKHGVTPCGH